MELKEMVLADLVTQALTEKLDDNGADGPEQKTTEYMRVGAVSSVISPSWDKLNHTISTKNRTNTDNESNSNSNSNINLNSNSNDLQRFEFDNCQLRLQRSHKKASKRKNKNRNKNKNKNKSKSKSTQTEKCQAREKEKEKEQENERAREGEGGGERGNRIVQREASKSLEMRQIENEINLGKHSKSQGDNHDSIASQGHEKTQTRETREARPGQCSSDVVAIDANRKVGNEIKMINNRRFMYSNINHDNQVDTNISKLNKSKKKNKLNQLSNNSNNQKMRTTTKITTTTTTTTTNHQRNNNNNNNNNNKTSSIGSTGSSAGGKGTRKGIRRGRGRTRRNRNRNRSSQLNDLRTIPKEPYFLIFEDLRLNCPRCSFVGTSQGKLVQHLRSHSNSRQCPHCNKKFGTLQNLIKHVRLHTGERPYPCPVIHCKWAYKQKGDLLSHIGRGKHGQV